METMAEGMAKGIAEGMAAMLTNAPVQAAQPPAQPAAAETAQDDAHPVIAIVRGMYLDAYSIKSAPRWSKGNYRKSSKGKGGRAVTQVTKQDTEAIANLNNELVSISTASVTSLPY